MRLRYTPRALADRNEIHQHLLERSPSGARHVMEHMDSALEMILIHPLAGTQTDIDGVRVVHLVRYPYRIFYAVNPDSIDVIHIRHTARVLPQSLNEPPQAAFDAAHG